MPRTLSFLFATALTALLFAATPALASRPHEFSKTFGAKCLAEPGCTGEALFNPAGVAVNEATGDVYVVDKGAGAVGGRVVRFGEEGAVRGEFNGSGSEAGVFAEPETIAVDNSCVLRKRVEPELTQIKCEEEDPSNGDVYVVDVGHFVIDKYSAGGEYLGQISEDSEGPFFHSLDGVAVDRRGIVWVYQEGQTITEYSNATPNALGARLEVNLPGGSKPGIAVDGKGDFYVNYHKESSGRIAKTDHSGKVLALEVENEETTAVAVDQSSNNALLDNLTSLAVLDAEGTPVERLGQESGAKHLSEGAGIGVNAGAETIYVADPGSGQVVVFGPSQPSAPKVESESFSEVTSDSANLAAVVNPHSEPKPEEGQTEYSFQYGRCPTVDPASCAGAGYVEVPGSAGGLSPDFEGQPVSAQLNGLAPGATYHFRAVASNLHGGGQPGEEATFTTQAAGGSVVLPDNRGWELVSPPDKLGARIEPLVEEGVVQAAADGGGITYLANSPTESQPQGYSNDAQVLSSRGAASWSSRDIGIPHTGSTGKAFNGPEYKLFSPELDSSVVQPLGPFIPQLSEEASEPTAYLHDLTASCGGDCFRALVTGKPGFANVPEGTVFGEPGRCESAETGTAKEFCGPQVVGASDDLSHVVLGANAVLRSGAGPGQLYEWAAGALSQVSILPGGEAAPAFSANLGSEESRAARRAISTDGSRVVWSTLTNLYTRDMMAGESGETVQLDKAEAKCEAEPGPEKCTSGGGKFEIASADGSRVFFSDSNRLSEDAGANPVEKEADLYECEIVLNGEGKLACELHDLTPKHGGEGASVQEGVLGASEDGSYVYFVANGVQSETPNSLGQTPVPDGFNLYVRHESTTTFITTLSGADDHDWASILEYQPARVSGNGRFLAFMSQASLTGYDNRDRASGQPVAEVYLYDATANRLSCASCDPTGARPTGVEFVKLEAGSSAGLAGGNFAWEKHALVAANVPGWTSIGPASVRSRHQPRYLDDSGRLFFNSADALVPQDSNGTEDVYEYEPPGTGGCSEALSTYSARSRGCVSLISSGSSAQESAFLDASESGDDVFFLSYAKLSPLDVDTSVDVYDAHVCTAGAPCITFPTTQVPPCTTEASCKPAPSPQPAIFGAPASATFQGLGNPTPAAPAKVVVKSLTRAQKLAAALKGCKRDRSKAKRAKCQKAARGKFGPVKSKHKK